MKRDPAVDDSGKIYPRSSYKFKLISFIGTLVTAARSRISSLRSATLASAVDTARALRKTVNKFVSSAVCSCERKATKIGTATMNLIKFTPRLRSRFLLLILIPTVIGIAAVGYGLHASSRDDSDADYSPSFQWSVHQAAGSAPIRPIPQQVPLHIGKIALGRSLFNDPRLSANNTLSCSSCHNLESAGADTESGSIGITGEPTPINSPTVFNSGLNAFQFWDGRAPDLETQAGGPIHAPGEMGSNWQQVIQKLSRDSQYVEQFNSIYSDGIKPENIADSIATFERSLIRPDAPFDRYLRGESGAISSAAVAGYSMFKSFGCASCHQGVNVGGNVYQKLGVIEPYFLPTDTNKHDQGRFNVTSREQDRHVFKVPSLRNVARTAPYLHDGSVPVLEEVIVLMAFHQLGRHVNKIEIESLKAFLHSLTAPGTP